MPPRSTFRAPPAPFVRAPARGRLAWRGAGAGLVCALVVALGTATSGAATPRADGTRPAADGARDAAADASSDAAAEGGASCGARGGPDCPLQALMKARVAPAATQGDLDELAAALDAVAAAAPRSGYPNWRSIAEDGARTARRGDLDAARAACRGCHEPYRAKYRLELRERRL